MILTAADITAIVAEMKEQGVAHACRYDIEPEDMKALMGFVRAFYDGAIETRRTVRTMLIRMLVWGTIAGALALIANRFGWLRPVIRVLIGAPQ